MCGLQEGNDKRQKCPRERPYYEDTAVAHSNHLFDRTTKTQRLCASG